jgi:hypothetical protein
MRKMRKPAVLAVLLPATIGTASAQVSAAPPGSLAFGCGSPKKVEAEASARLASVVASPVVQADQRNAARAAIRKIGELRRNVLAGKPTETPYREASRFAALATNAASSEVAELYMRVAKDQFTRSHFTAALQRANWAADLSDHALNYAYYVIASDGCDVDEANTQWLKAQLGSSGWFTISKYGEEADSAAWLLVQHADRDTAFQNDVLRILTSLVGRKETSPANYAYLYDRVAVNSKRPQRYGTQGRCAESGIWEPRPIEDPSRLNERRAAIGLEPQAAYSARFTCRAAPPRR